MVPSDFTPYFTAAAAAAGVLIGLLFVAVSLRPDTIFGRSAPPLGRAQAGSAFTSLVNCFFVSLVALIPQAGLGVVSIVVAVISAMATRRLHREAGPAGVHRLMLAVSMAVYTFQFIVGVAIEFHQNSVSLVQCVAFLMIGQISVALSRAWALMEGRHLAQPADAPPEGSG